MPNGPPMFDAALAAELASKTWIPSVRKLWDGTKNTRPAPPDWLGSAALTHNLAGLHLGGPLRAIAGAVALVRTRDRGLERWALVAVRGVGGVEWAVAYLGPA